MRRAAKVDANQSQIVAALRKLGYTVATNHDDILVGANGLTLWVEIKADKVKAKKQLRKSQLALLENWKGAYLVATDVEEIVGWFKSKEATRGKE